MFGEELGSLSVCLMAEEFIRDMRAKQKPAEFRVREL
jgi:hypothetical protein